jgi:hypothetical protein
MASESLAVLRANVPSFQRFDPTMQPLLLLRAGAFCYAAADVATCTVADNAHTMAPGAGRSRVGPGANHLARRWPHCTVQDSLSRQGFPNSQRLARETRVCRRRAVRSAAARSRRTEDYVARIGWLSLQIAASGPRDPDDTSIKPQGSHHRCSVQL